MFTPFCWHLSYINHCYSLLIFVYLVEEKNFFLFFIQSSYNNVIKCSYKVKKHNTIIKNIKKEKLTQQYSVSIQNSIKLYRIVLLNLEYL